MKDRDTPAPLAKFLAVAAVLVLLASHNDWWNRPTRCAQPSPRTSGRGMPRCRTAWTTSARVVTTITTTATHTTHRLNRMRPSITVSSGMGSVTAPPTSRRPKARV